MAANFRCSGINLRKRVPFNQIGGSAGNDIWGWYDSTTGNEYAIVGMTNGTAFVDVTDPQNPLYLGLLPTRTASSNWRDIKVYRDHAYIVADAAAFHRMQVFDLTELRGITGPAVFTETAHYNGFGDAHNLAINEDSGFGYAVGTSTCNGGLHMIDLSVPASPEFAGCHDFHDTHDTQCVIYHGPDIAYTGREICFNANEDHIEIVDVTDKSATVTLSTFTYPSLGFVHQGWLNTEHSLFFIGDELDEIRFNLTTRTNVIDVTDLDNPSYSQRYESTLRSTDHNLYVRGNRIYEGNYASGLRVLGISDFAPNELSEVAFFDTFPASDDAGFDGVWSVYPYLPSGNLIVNDRDNGLFILSMDAETAFATAPARAREREAIQIDAIATGAPTMTTWVQTRGTAASISDPNAIAPTITLPSLSAPELLAFDMVVESASGPRAIDTVYIQVDPYPPLSPALVSSPSLQQCIEAAYGSAQDAGEVVALTCSNVDDADGLERFPNITSLSLSGQSLATTSSISSLASLESLDLSGFSSLPCGALDALEAGLDASVAFLAPTICRGVVISYLGRNAFDSELDLPRRQLYVSVPGRHEIVVISLDTGLIVDRLLMPGEPWGIDLSLDGSRLFAAINQNDAVIEIDLATTTWRSIPLNGVPIQSTTYDVVEAQADRLFVSATGLGLSRLVQVRLDQGDDVTQVADQRIVSFSPTMLASNDGQSLFLGEKAIPGLSRLDLTDPAAPIALDAISGSVTGTTELALDASNSRLALGSGQVVHTSNFAEVGTIAAAVPSVNSDGTHFAVNVDPTRVEFYNAQSLLRDWVSPIECEFFGPADLLHSYDSDAAFAVIHERQVCVTLVAPRGTVLDALSEFRFPDLSLENCVRTEALTHGWTTAADVVSLDCAASTPPIRSIEGIERLQNLTTLDISNNEIFDFFWLLTLDNLTTLTIANSTVANLRPIEVMTGLTALDLTGSANVSCDSIDALEAGGIAVTADECAAFRQAVLVGDGLDLELDEVNNRAFVSVPTLNQILEVDLTTLTTTRSLATSGMPRGIDLSQDGMTLYAALNGSGSIAYLDVATGVETDVVDISAELDDMRTHDIVEISPDRLLVSADPNSNSLAYIVEVRRDLGNSAQRVADTRVIRSVPEFVVAPDGSSVFVSEGFRPGSIYKLDATQANLPIIAEDTHGSLGITDNMQINPSGTLLINVGGWLVDTSNVNVVGLLPAGLPTFSRDGAKVLIGDRSLDVVRIYDVATRRHEGDRHWGCYSLRAERITTLSDGSPLVLGDNLLCTIEQVAR